ncbi:peptide-methionine (R)-S-oxide reductase MsrB [Psychroflexus salis]|uniref:peptide-methionine (R)-S-oxide reductase n=1 Tax=Psychroflexus salis TaxID=1526574 RepID=A0A916ZTW6_9FLAO|nr:peptide-methionine (R)-S-oxide reductase MsrB [Psychroflexus salis]GGE12483.1 peptide-methionine (R)-S-oxide reductase [Psychroflexus salis]
MKKLIVLFTLFSLACNTTAQQEKQTQTEKKFEVEKSEQEWKSELSEMEFQVLRKAATERAFSSSLNNIKKAGTFVCAACENPLYKTKDKFNSGTGWPSFDRAIEGSLAYSSDRKLGYKRDEALCGKCGGHLGHIFEDGPRETTGMRHCINGVALKFVPDEKEK